MHSPSSHDYELELENQPCQVFLTAVHAALLQLFVSVEKTKNIRFVTRLAYHSSAK
eukprot:m.65705 g.65705  ORF g.65705 m.65705 type:complete len:56 (-) comp19654_c0_seq3:91-258(-)